MLDVLRTLFRTAFLDLSFRKRWLLRAAGAAAAVGLVAQAWMLLAGAQDGGIAWPRLAWTTGLGCLAGFVVGAAVRIFSKVALTLGLGLVVLGFLCSWLGWLELPWSSWGEAARELGLAVDRHSRALHSLLSGYLPAGGATAVGLGTGLTQRPQFDDDTD